MPIISLSLLIILLILILIGIFESILHNKTISNIPIRIHVNGTRGKSSVVRLIAAGLRAGGIKTLAKTTHHIYKGMNRHRITNKFGIVNPHHFTVFLPHPTLAQKVIFDSRPPDALRIDARG